MTKDYALKKMCLCTYLGNAIIIENEMDKSTIHVSCDLGVKFVLEWNTENDKVYSQSTMYCIRFGETDIDNLYKKMKEKEKEYLEIIKQITGILAMSEEEMKKYLINNIDKVDFLRQFKEI